MKKEIYREKISEIQDYLTTENQAYFKDLYDTIFLNGALRYKEKAMFETSYNLLLDLLDAQHGGEKAEDYFGMTSDKMAKKILKKMEKETPTEIRKIIGYIGLSALFWTYFGSINWFLDKPLSLSWINYIVGCFVYILAAIIFFRVILKRITFKNKGLTFLISGFYISCCIGIFVIIELNFKDIQAFYVPALLSKMIGIILAVGYGILTYTMLKERD